MPRNILIFSDGTGQAGGLTPDENISNIYKLYRATRCGPDTGIDPSQQLTFYDPGLGSQPVSGLFSVTRIYRWLHDLVSQATGLGITTNIIDCYAALLRMWQPGDRIFLFGFSRGAYTVRCVASVLSFCGIPTTMADGETPLFRDVNSTRKIAKEAVKQVYEHVGSPKDTAYLEQRKALALRFRRKYESDVNGAPNVNPFFIGVFDTVASLGSYSAAALAVVGWLAFLALVSAMVSFGQSFRDGELRSIVFPDRVPADLCGAHRAIDCRCRDLVRDRPCAICHRPGRVFILADGSFHGAQDAVLRQASG